MGQALSTVGKRGLALAILAVAALVLFKVVVGFLAGLVWIAVAIVALLGIVWALRVLVLR